MAAALTMIDGEIENRETDKKAVQVKNSPIKMHLCGKKRVKTEILMPNWQYVPLISKKSCSSDCGNFFRPIFPQRFSHE